MDVIDKDEAIEHIVNVLEESRLELVCEVYKIVCTSDCKLDEENQKINIYVSDKK